ncbi:NACHT, LRR and PYD domains-containing protein 3 [Danio aesculapii]|uniref:NACHT, LRR and PYD domains-containing protein 3 n=1 Tax=Danio aesculapii TaxID=1142201 RepID=UPI0024BF7B01|nr:NACHT, LRR and PYD domains-containing protein 3 [Danio aesculapii]
MSLDLKRKKEDVQTASSGSSCVSQKSAESLPQPPNFSLTTPSPESKPTTVTPDIACKMSLDLKKEEEEEDVQTDEAASPESSSVSVRSVESIPQPPNFSLTTPSPESSLVSVRSVESIPQPPNFNLRTPSPESSSVSVRSVESIPQPPNFSLTTPSPESSSVSVRSVESIPQPPNFNLRTPSPESSSVSVRSVESIPQPLNFSLMTPSPESSSVSVRSVESIPQPPNFNLRTPSPESSSVSVRSVESIPQPPNFNLRTPSPESSSVSVRSVESIPQPLNFSLMTPSPESSSVSVRSVESIPQPPNFSLTTPSPESSSVSVRSVESIPQPPNFNLRTPSPESSSVSVRSVESIPQPPNFNLRTPSPESSSVSVRSVESIPQPPNFNLRTPSPESSSVSVRSVESIPQPPNFSLTTPSSKPKTTKKQRTMSSGLKRGAAVRSMTYQHKTCMKNKYERLFEGINLTENQTLLNRIYTQLYIIEGESEGVNEEHEVLQMEKTARTQDTPIYCNDIFKPLNKPEHEEKDQIKTVLTKGIAGIGKTVSVQKFILDWSEGKANQDVDFMFVLPFRELNLIKDHQYSLHRLLLDFHPELQDLDSEMYEECKVVFIFDGLDESRIPLKFSDVERVSDVNESSSVAVLMSNLIRGDLLPSALIWITSRPAAANQIPSKYIHRLTEIQGFNELQKEEYFRKRISDVGQASRIISHIRRSRSLHIMCHIPVFCWISATVLQKLLNQDDRAEIPQTLTEMYIHFLLTQINTRNQKYEERDPEKLLESSRDVIVKLAELAFNQLMKGNVMFYEEDLIESGIDVTDASVYSGICTEIFKVESVIHQRKVYSFIHLSFQEFLAAFFVFYCYVVKNERALKLLLGPNIHSTLQQCRCVFGIHWDGPEMHLSNLLSEAVLESLRSENGHLDLFLRFLLGVSLESNQKLFQDLLPHTESSSESIKRITQFIKDKIKGKQPSRSIPTSLGIRSCENLKPNNLSASAERSINLFLCLLEMKDQTPHREIQEFMISEHFTMSPLSSSHCSTIAYILQISEEVLDEFDLKRYKTSDEGRWRLIPAVVNCRKALLDCCNLTGQCCESLSSCLQSSNSLRELDLSHNDLQDSGVKLLSDGLKSSQCQLEILKLAGCNLTGQCCKGFSSLLQSSNSLIELDLSLNDLQDSGVELLSDGLKSVHCQLEKLRLSGCMVTEEGCCFLASALRLNPSHLKELDLSYNNPGESLAELISDPNCRLEKLNVDHGGKIKAGPQKYACNLTLDLNTASTYLALSEGNRKVTRLREEQPYPDHPERFDEYNPQVLCKESLTGRCYWEVELSGGEIYISVAYKGISRKGWKKECWMGLNDMSWILNCFYKTFFVRHYNKFELLEKFTCPINRVGVFLDWPAGTLSFYNVSDTNTLTLLHTFKTTFTEPLHAGFRIGWDSSVSLCDI